MMVACKKLLSFFYIVIMMMNFTVHHSRFASYNISCVDVIIDSTGRYCLFRMRNAESSLEYRRYQEEIYHEIVRQYANYL